MLVYLRVVVLGFFPVFIFKTSKMACGVKGDSSKEWKYMPCILKTQDHILKLLGWSSGLQYFWVQIVSHEESEHSTIRFSGYHLE